MKQIKNTYKALMLGLFLGTTSVYPLQAQNGTVKKITLSQAITLSVNNHPLIKEAEDQLAVAHARSLEQKSAFYPTAGIDINDNLIGPRPFFEITAPIHNQFYLTPKNNLNGNFAIHYLVYDFKRRQEILKLFRSNELTGAEKIDLIRFQLAYQTAKVYYSILYLNKSMEVMNHEICDLREHFDVARKLVLTGSATGLDTLNTRVRLTVLINQQSLVNTQREKAKVLLKSLMNLPPAKKIHLAGNFEKGFKTYSLDSLLQKAFNQREELKINQLISKTTRIHKNIISKSNLPLISAHGSIGIKNGYPESLSRLKGNYVIGLSAQIPVFDGYHRKSQLKTADWQIKTIDDHELVIKQKIRTEIENELLDYKNNKVQLHSAAEEIKQTQAAMNQAKGLYETGSITNTTLLDTETALSRAQLKYTHQLFQLTLSRYQILQAIGEKIW